MLLFASFALDGCVLDFEVQVVNSRKLLPSFTRKSSRVFVELYVTSFGSSYSEQLDE